MSRISEDSNSLRLSDFKGIVRYSYKCLKKNRNRQPLRRKIKKKKRDFDARFLITIPLPIYSHKKGMY